MPDVVRGVGNWTAGDFAHLASCALCALEWRLVERGAALGADSIVDPSAIATGVLARLAADREAPRVVRRIPWRGGAIGLVAVAAAAILVIAISGHPDSTTAVPSAAAPIAILPELQNLSDQQLEVVQASLGPTAADATPGLVPHLGDLTESELEDLLRSEGGQ
jgi:hypothetical protein